MPSSNSCHSTGSNSSANSYASNVSQTSTVEFEHEPFEQYVSRVRQLCDRLWPSADATFAIERLRGGSFNRIIGITSPSVSSSVGGRYVLRVPRFDEGQQERELAILRYVRAHTSIPVADIIFSDATDDNPLGSPYVIQSRLAGSNMFDLYRSLPFEQQKNIAIEFGRILLAEQAVQNNISGVVEATKNEAGDHIYRIVRFPVDPEPEINPEVHIPSDTASVRNTYLTLFRLQEASTRQHFPGATMTVDRYQRLAAVAEQMDVAGLFKDIPNCLCHLDLMPRNMLVDIRDDGSATISGVLDWDSAILAPSFISCSPPSWIWNWAEDEEEDPAKANDTPDTTEMQDLKRIFEETVGPQFLFYSYSPEYQLARRLFDLALHGIKTNEAIVEAETVLKEWRKMKLSFGLSTDSEGSDNEDQEEQDELSADEGGSASPDQTSDYEDGEDSTSTSGHEALLRAVEQTAARLEETQIEAENP